VTYFLLVDTFFYSFERQSCYLTMKVLMVKISFYPRASFRKSNFYQTIKMFLECSFFKFLLTNNILISKKKKSKRLINSYNNFYWAFIKKLWNLQTIYEFLQRSFCLMESTVTYCTYRYSYLCATQRYTFSKLIRPPPLPEPSSYLLILLPVNAIIFRQIIYSEMCRRV